MPEGVSVALVGLLLGTAAASGLRLYATIAILGFLGRAGIVALPGDLHALTHGGVIAVAASLYLVEFVADKIPFVDSAWDAIHTFLRPPAAGLLAWAALSNVPAPWRIAAALVCGGVAFSTHGLKAGARAVLNTSPEPVTNAVASLSEDGLVVLLIFLAVRHPVAASLLALALVLLGLLVASWIWRILRRLVGRRTPAAA